jgi:hypothetical protein
MLPLPANSFTLPLRPMLLANMDRRLNPCAYSYSRFFPAFFAAAHRFFAASAIRLRAAGLMCRTGAAFFTAGASLRCFAHRALAAAAIRPRPAALMRRRPPRRFGADWAVVAGGRPRRAVVPVEFSDSRAAMAWSMRSRSVRSSERISLVSIPVVFPSSFLVVKDNRR